MEITLVFLAMIVAVRPEVSDDATRAYSNQFKVDETLDRYSKTLISNEHRRYVGNAALFTKIIVEKRATYEWSF